MRSRARQLVGLALAMLAACRSSPDAGSGRLRTSRSVLPAAKVRDAPRFVAQAPFAPAGVVFGDTLLEDLARTYGQAKVDRYGEERIAGSLCYRLEHALLVFHASDGLVVDGLSVSAFPSEPRMAWIAEDCAPANARARTLVEGAALQIGMTPEQLTGRLGEPTNRHEDHDHRELALVYEADVEHDGRLWRYTSRCTFHKTGDHFELDAYDLSRFEPI